MIAVPERLPATAPSAMTVATTDGGKQWKPTTLVDGEAGEKHLNRIVVGKAGTWLVTAEGGLVLRAEGTGADARWSAIETPYKGSLWTGLALADGALLAGGMRGNVVRSADDGRTWTHIPVAQAGSLTGGAVLADGRPVFVGVDGTVVVGDAAGGSFRVRNLDDRATLTAAVALPGGAIVASTLAGMRNLVMT